MSIARFLNPDIFVECDNVFCLKSEHMYYFTTVQETKQNKINEWYTVLLWKANKQMQISTVCGIGQKHLSSL